MMVNLASEWSRQGHTVDLVVAEFRGPYVDAVPDDVNVVDLGVHRAAAALPGLVGYLRKNRPDAFLSTMVYANVISIVAHSLAAVDSRLVLREAAVPMHNPEKPVASSLWLLFRACGYRLADGIIAISSDVGHALSTTARVPYAKITVIPNPAYSADAVALGEVAPAHPWLSEDVPVVLCAGRLTKLKGFDTVIEAVARLKSERDVRLIILGEGPYRKSLEKLVGEFGMTDHVDLPGFVDNPFPYYRHASVFALASTREAFGNVVVEALGMGTPVVSSDCPGGPSEILEGGKWGELVPVGDVEAFENALRRAIDNEHDRERLIARAKEFSVSDIAARYLSVMLGDDSERSYNETCPSR